MGFYDDETVHGYMEELDEQRERIAQLEQLCRDMYPFIDELGLDTVCGNPDGEDCQQPCDKCEYYIAPIRQCMEQLGLLEGGDK